jgi:hypothetical protein
MGEAKRLMQRSRSRWVSIKTPPPLGKLVLAFFENGEQRVVRDAVDYNRITHWRLLPAPPRR